MSLSINKLIEMDITEFLNRVNYKGKIAEHIKVLNERLEKAVEILIEIKHRNYDKAIIMTKKYFNNESKTTSEGL